MSLYNLRGHDPTRVISRGIKDAFFSPSVPENSLKHLVIAGLKKAQTIEKNDLVASIASENVAGKLDPSQKHRELFIKYDFLCLVQGGIPWK